MELKSIMDIVNRTESALDVKERIHALMEDYADLSAQQRQIAERIEQIKGEIMDAMVSHDISKYQDSVGVVQVIEETTRSSYPKADLDSIALQNATLRRVLGKIIRTSSIPAHIRITLANKG